MTPGVSTAPNIGPTLRLTPPGVEKPSGGHAPQAPSQTTPGPQAPAPFRNGNDVPKANGKMYAVPDGAEDSLYEKITNLFEDLFGRVLTSAGKAGIRQLIRASMREDGSIAIDGDFLDRLAEVTGRSSREITEKAIDAMWGNGNGSLGEDDSFADLAEFIRRTEELVPIFAVKAEAGESIYDFMRSNNIVFVPESRAGKIFKKTIDFAELYNRKDRLFLSCLQYASRGYLRSMSRIKGEDAATAAQKELDRIVKDGDWKSLPDEFATLLFVAYKTTFDFHLKDKDIDFDSEVDLRQPDHLALFMRGIFKDYVAGREIDENGRVKRGFVHNIDVEEINLDTLMGSFQKVRQYSKTLASQKAAPEA